MEDSIFKNYIEITGNIKISSDIISSL